MIKNWEVYKKQERDAVFFDGYKYEDEGSSFNLLVFDSNYETTYYKIFFPKQVECFRFFHLSNDWQKDEKLDDLVFESNTPVPCVPFFIRDDSDLIKEVQAMESYDARNKEYLHYIMAPEGMWIDIVSSVEPIITVQEERTDSWFV